MLLVGCEWELQKQFGEKKEKKSETARHFFMNPRTPFFGGPPPFLCGTLGTSVEYWGGAVSPFVFSSSAISGRWA
jgi:hypothetical protein